MCPGQSTAYVRNSTSNAALVLLKGNDVEGYGGAALGDAPVNIAPPAVFSTGDVIRVAEYFPHPGSPVVFSSNTVTVGCEVHTRKDISKLTAAQIDSLRKGFMVMMRRSHMNPADPRGLTYQANLHSTVASSGACLMGNASNPLWDQCQHYSDLFLPWHRMYLYYFERILREASGDPNLTLPYWNYESASEQTLPAAFRTPAIDCAGDPDAHPGCNLLYVPGRYMNAGEMLSPGAASDSMAMMDTTFEDSFGGNFGGGPPPGTPPAECHFDNAQGDLEKQPHDIIHSQVGPPYMEYTTISANDPIFWEHHAEIDHLWKVWLAQGGGRKNPTSDNAWMNSSFKFYDETGKLVSLSVKDALDTVTQLD